MKKEDILDAWLQYANKCVRIETQIRIKQWKTGRERVLKKTMQNENKRFEVCVFGGYAERSIKWKQSDDKEREATMPTNI